MQDKLARLLEIKTANYRANNDPHPEAAAAFAMEHVVRLINGQPKYAEQLLNEEIEDALKAGAPSKFYSHA